MSTACRLRGILFGQGRTPDAHRAVRAVCNQATHTSGVCACSAGDIETAIRASDLGQNALCCSGTPREQRACYLRARPPINRSRKGAKGYSPDFRWRVRSSQSDCWSRAHVRSRARGTRWDHSRPLTRRRGFVVTVAIGLVIARGSNFVSAQRGILMRALAMSARGLGFLLAGSLHSTTLVPAL